MGTVHIVGAGVAGLACAVALVQSGRTVVVYEAAGHAGGRCRSFHDESLGCTIDNGNHLLLSGNQSVARYLAAIGATGSLTGPAETAFPFIDLETGERWTVRPNAGPLPWWIFAPDRRVPGMRVRDCLQAFRLACADSQATIAQCLDTRGEAFRRFWEPLTVAVLNTPPDTAAAALLWPVLRDTFGRGAAACRPLIARTGLSDSFVDPALQFLRRHGATVAFGHLLRRLERTETAVTALDFGSGSPILLGAGDCVVLAVPHHRAQPLLPELALPQASHAIVNAHFRLPQAPSADTGEVSFLGLIGGTAQWLFLRSDIAAVTVSAADSLADRPGPEIAARIWLDVARALNRPNEPLPPYRIVKERRATFAQTPAAVARRPGAPTAWSNLFLAGDWTDTGLPATIEGSILSGFTAADMLARAS